MQIITGCLAFLAAFILTRQLQPHGILFYQGVACAVVCALVQGVVCWRWTRASCSTTVGNCPPRRSTCRGFRGRAAPGR